LIAFGMTGGFGLLKLMISYNKIASREDHKFHRVAKRVLGNDYGAACVESSEAFVKGYQSGTITTRDNCARRAANLVILRWMADHGVSNWQDLDAPQVKRKPVNNARQSFVSDVVKERKFNSSDGLWSNKI